jgi:hypothetical protein
VTPNDGVRDGTCQGGLASGACDVNGTHPTFGPTSLDCRPNSAQNISGNGLQINLRFTTGSQSLAAALPCDAGIPGPCFCRVCSGDGTLGCTSNADCAAANAGTCTAGGGAGVRPNQCDDLTCSAQGRCDAGPIDMYCDGITHPDGRGFITCVGDADCQALGAGSCTIAENRRCFPNPIAVEGRADTAVAVRGAIFCIPATNSPAVNASGGLPGPGTFELEFEPDVRCRDDLSAYESPSGVNCSTAATTTTTLAVPQCANATPPLCVGSCSVGEACEDLGGACGCTPPVTLPACGGQFPLCTGSCATGQLCLPDVLSQSCLCTVPPVPEVPELPQLPGVPGVPSLP